ncbi:CRE-CPT-6 protein, partial [Aphelenchoides avenae]
MRLQNALYPVPTWLFTAFTTGLFAQQVYRPTVYVGSVRKALVGNLPLPQALRILEAAVISLSLSYGVVFLLRTLISRFIFGYHGYLFDGRKPSLTTKLWTGARRLLAAIAPPQLGSCEALLPTLPIPTLKGTIERYLESLEPLMNEKEYAEVKDLADEFLLSEGPKLQFYAKLQWWTTFNYVTPLWEKYAYLASRDPLMGNTSVGFLDFYTNVSYDPARRAAVIAYTETLMSLATYRQQLAPVADGLISTAMYKKVPCQSRVPGEMTDALVSHLPTRHIVVLSKGHIYEVGVFDDTGKIYSLEQLYEIFVDIRRRPARNSSDPPSMLPALTFDRRDRWARNRTKFFVDVPTNGASLDVIESAILAITFDEAEDYGYDPKRPELLDKFTKEMMTGNGCNRWVDKCKNYVVSKNGRLGGTAEHTPADGSEWNHAGEILAFIETKVQKHPPDVKDIDDFENWQPSSGLKLARQLDFEISAEMSKEIERCYAEYQPIKDNIDVASFVFTEFGKGRIKKFSCSPDAFVQMALQLTYYKLHSRFVLTYEPASTKFYRNSRTEALRTVSKESCSFVRSMLDTSVTNTERVSLLKAACETHTKKGRLGMTGKGVDRHLFVLYLMSRGKGIKSAFLERYASQQWTLTTSQ